jgi:hypothetical protein
MAIALQSWRPRDAGEAASLRDATPRGADLLREAPLGALPALLEYRSEADPDAEFIPKTVAGFGMGSLAMGATLLIAEMALGRTQSGQEVAMKFAFMFGVACVSASLLLVGLKVRADHSAVTLFSRHWMNSIATGAGFALLVWGPWELQNHAIIINRFLAAVIWMAIMAFPALASRWTIGSVPKRPA